MYLYKRKCEFYEARHGRTADRRLVISPMIEPRALAVAKKLDIETYTTAWMYSFNKY